MPRATLLTNTRAKMQPGWTLTNVWPGGSAPAIIVILDAEALPVWYFVHGRGADQFGMTSTQWLPNQHILIGNASTEPPREVDLEANIVWEGPTGGTPAASHHTGKTASGNYLIVRESNTTARVEEISLTNTVVRKRTSTRTARPGPRPPRPTGATRTRSPRRREGLHLLQLPLPGRVQGEPRHQGAVWLLARFDRAQR